MAPNPDGEHLRAGKDVRDRVATREADGAAIGAGAAAEDGERGRWIPKRPSARGGLDKRPPALGGLDAGARPRVDDERLPSHRPRGQTGGHCDRVAVARQRGGGNRSRHPPLKRL